MTKKSIIVRKRIWVKGYWKWINIKINKGEK
jgi:hypothetical protein